MNVKKFSWTRPLALFVALTMIMMYSVGGVAFAVQPEDGSGNAGYFLIKYQGDDDIVFNVDVSYTIDGEDFNFTSLASHKGGINYEGDFGPNFPTMLDSDFIEAHMTITIVGSDAEVLSFDVFNAEGSGTLNIKDLVIDFPVVEDTFDLVITKVADISNVTLGSIVTYTITAENVGNTTITGVTVSDSWTTDGLEDVIAVSGNASEYDADEQLWTIGTIGPGQTKTLDLAATTSALGTVTNIAVGDLVEEETGDGDNTDDAVIQVFDPTNPPADTFDLVINKVADNNSVTLGSVVTYTITAKNSGNTTVTGVTVSDIWTAGLIDVMVQSADGVGFNLETKVWDVGSIGPNNLDTKTLVLKATANAIGIVTNTAIGTAAEDDDSLNNTDDAVIVVFDPTQPPAPDRDLGITKTVNLGNVLLGTPVTFTVTITNTGDVTYNDVEVKDEWPTGLAQTTITPETGTTYVAIDNIWEVGTLAPGEDRVLIIAAGTPTTGTFTNEVEILGVEGSWSDDNASNNTASAIVTVTTEDDGDNNTPTRRTTTTVPIPEEEPPLTEAPVIEPEIVDEPAPLADVPQTDDTSNIFLLLGLMLASGAGIAALGRRKETVEK